MSNGTIYVVDGDGLRRMVPSAPESEDRMQILVAKYPELITDGSGALLLIAREAGIGDGEVSSRWSLDHLFVSQDAVPVLVELKRASDTRLRREVVGQLIDYAANSSVHWQAGSIAAAFAATVGNENADSILAEFIGDRDPEEFWKQVDSNLRSGRIKLVFVADVIPRELAIVVEFLNSQMRADVRAIELKWFEDGAGLTTLVPRVIGQSEQAVASKSRSSLPTMEVADWISERIARHGAGTLTGVELACEVFSGLGGDVFVPSTRGSLVASWSAEDGKKFYPFGVYPSGIVVVRLGYLKSRPAFSDEGARRELYDRLTRLVGPLHRKNMSGEPGFSASLLNDSAIAQEFETFVRDTVEAGGRTTLGLSEDG